MIVDRIYEYLGGPKGVVDAVQEGLLDVAMAAFRRTLRRNFLEDRQAAARDVSPSSAWYCGRRLLYGMREDQAHVAPQAPRSSITFAWGDTAEAMGLLLTRVAGVPLLSPAEDGTQQEVEVPIGGELRPGHLDASMLVHGVESPIDYKSMSDTGFGEFEAAIRDPRAPWWTEHKWDIVTQQRLYMRALERKHGQQVNVSIVIGVNKNTGHLAECHVPQDRAHLSALDSMLPRLRAHQAAGTLPDRPAFATTASKTGDNLRADGSKGPVEEITAWRCGYCPHVKACFPGFDLVPLKSKPVWRRPA